MSETTMNGTANGGEKTCTTFEVGKTYMVFLMKNDNEVKGCYVRIIGRGKVTMENGAELDIVAYYTEKSKGCTPKGVFYDSPAVAVGGEKFYPTIDGKMCEVFAWCAVAK